MHVALRSFLRSSHCSRPSARTLSSKAPPLATSRILVTCLPCYLEARQRGSTPKSLPRRYSTRPSSPTTISEPSRSSLFYHLLPAPNPSSLHLPAYAVSLLERSPRDPHGPAVMGWLPAAANAEEGEEAGLGDFKANPRFMEALHSVVRGAIADGADDRLEAEAMQLGEGWMHVNDDRNLPPMGRVGSPDDIIASVRVENGKLLPDTYNPMPTYRTCTTDGLTTLSPGLQRRLLEELKRIDGAAQEK